MRRLLRAYARISMVTKMLGALAVGSALGVCSWMAKGRSWVPPVAWLNTWVLPLGTLFVHMLKMVVVPVVCVSLISGAASLPAARFGRVGARVVGWYLLTSLLAACVGVVVAVVVNPGRGLSLEAWGLEGPMPLEAGAPVGTQGGSTTVATLLSGIFRNPVEALASGNFLSIIVFSVLFGLATKLTVDAGGVSGAHAEQVLSWVKGVQASLMRMVDWVLQYGPVGVLALSWCNFATHGPAIAGPYVAVVAGVVVGVMVMMGVVYPVLMGVLARKNPLAFYRASREALLTAFVTRSSAATLPVTLRTATSRLGVPPSISSFSLPLGATVNMDGVCVHLPLFGVLAANLFGLHLSALQLASMVIMTVLASIGAGGVPGGSLMLLFLILGTMGLKDHQISTVVALAMAVNPIVDMFETMNNVADDLVCTYVVASSEGMLQGEGAGGHGS